MKLYKFILVVTASAFASAAFAAMAPVKQVTLPFYNEAIFSKDHSGLIFNYNMGTNSNRTVTCKLHHVYKSWLEFTDHGAAKESHVYGGQEAVVLSSNTKSISADEFSADPKGTVTIRDVKDFTGANASCYYVG